MGAARVEAMHRWVLPIAFLFLAGCGQPPAGEETNGAADPNASPAGSSEETASETQAPAPTAPLVAVERWFWLNHTGGHEGWPVARSGDHCGRGSWSAEPPSLVLQGSAPRSVLVEQFNKTTLDSQASRYGGLLGIHAWTNTTWTFTLPAAFDPRASLAIVSLQGDHVTLDGTTLAVGERRTREASYSFEHQSSTYDVDERLVVRNLGTASVQLIPAQAACG